MSQTNLTQCMHHMLNIKNCIRADCSYCPYISTPDCDPSLCNSINATLDYFINLADKHIALEAAINTFLFNIEGLHKTSSEELQPAYSSVLKLAEELNLKQEN